MHTFSCHLILNVFLITILCAVCPPNFRLQSCNNSQCYSGSNLFYIFCITRKITSLQASPSHVCRKGEILSVSVYSTSSSSSYRVMQQDACGCLKGMILYTLLRDRSLSVHINIYLTDHSEVKQNPVSPPCTLPHPHRPPCISASCFC